MFLLDVLRHLTDELDVFCRLFAAQNFSFFVFYFNIPNKISSTLIRFIKRILFFKNWSDIC